MNGLSIISTLLLVPPVCVRITELSFNWRRVDISSILRTELDGRSRVGYMQLTIPGSSASVFSQVRQQAVSSSIQRRTSPLTNDRYSGPACAAPRCCPKAVLRGMGRATRSGRAVAIRRESICKKSQRDQLNIQARGRGLHLCVWSPRLEWIIRLKELVLSCSQLVQGSWR